VPTTHPPTAAIPAVSGSSGRLVVTPPKQVEAERTWPGQAFASTERSYPEAMDQFVAARRAAAAAKPLATVTETTGDTDRKAVRRALRAQEARLRIARDTERERRRLSDAAWKQRQQEHQAVLIARREARAPSRAALRAQHHAEWSMRHQELLRRRQEDVRWREERTRQRENEQAVGIGQVRTWGAILVLVDNCTRVCLGLPLFTLGAHVTAELVAEALRTLLPQELTYLITDGGTHFTADVIRDLARELGFVRVPLAKHRPQSNGIAERFIETLKGWLAEHPWETSEELAALLTQFRIYYNDRPHRGRELAGLSPNEYAARTLVA
jgi:transposase InsO family protein